MTVLLCSCYEFFRSVRFLYPQKGEVDRDKESRVANPFATLQIRVSASTKNQGLLSRELAAFLLELSEMLISSLHKFSPQAVKAKLKCPIE